MKNVLNVIIIISSITTIAAIVLQQKGSGLSGVFGGSDVSYMTKRGAEKFLVIFTIVSAVILCSSALLILFV
jgi:protein translocase SecG subunit